ncbi:hypothetical protein PV04_00346 [Phialophora macrospora]|uniref:WSC domain-containing protein n=1 Tax=Phialophora macrospora TaxID=1851006 RepID=A0A0D2D3N0_9EURO|nr:hypothetical protein PV04_00346 [Phialophora macrospora]
MKRMRSSIFALCPALFTLLRLVSGQSIVPTASSPQFPGCAVGCTVLLQAQSSCVPPNVATTDQITYENCFCQSGILQPLYGTPDSVCAAECTIESDRDLLQTWFTGFCQQVGQGIDPLATASVSSVTVVTVTSYSTASPTATSTGTGSASAPATSSHQSWIEGHWRWILMLGILAVGLPLFAWLLVCLKRRHRRKLEDRRAAASGFPTSDEKRAGARSATPELWGPHQHMHYTKGWEYHNDPTIVGSGALASSSGQRDRKLKRESSSHHNQRGHAEMTQFGDSRPTSRPPASRRHSSKGKSRAGDEIRPVDSRGSHMAPANRSRSRSQRRRDPDSDLERDTADPQHERRLREVRGGHRKRDNPR